MQSQLKALVTENKQIKEQLKTSTNKPDDVPKPEENETRTVDGQTWMYCKHCFIGRRWNKTHKSAEHKRGLGKNKKKEKQDTANLSEYDINLTGDTDFQSG
jgi:hypothetical protein